MIRKNVMVITMVKRSKGLMVNTRQVFKKSPRDRGEPPITRYLQNFKIGDRANIVIEPTSQKGQPHHRYHGRVGTVVGIKGQAYVISVKMAKTNKELIVRPEHLRPVKE
jgi:large subunit ribosomal protein L21e